MKKLFELFLSLVLLTIAVAGSLSPHAFSEYFLGENQWHEHRSGLSVEGPSEVRLNGLDQDSPYRATQEPVDEHSHHHSNFVQKDFLSVKNGDFVFELNSSKQSFLSYFRAFPQEPYLTTLFRPPIVG